MFGKEKGIKIGKQQVLFKIILGENQKVQDGELSFVNDEDLFQWIDCTKEQLTEAANTCARLNDFILCTSAAKKYTDVYYNTEECYYFWVSTFLWIGGIYISMLQKGIVDIPMLFAANKKCYNEYGIEDRSLTSLERGLQFFVRYIIQEITLANQKYDWSVLQLILDKNIKFEITKETFDTLKKEYHDFYQQGSSGPMGEI